MDTVRLDSGKVSKLPDSSHYPIFYKKYLDADGISVMGSEKVRDEAFFVARRIVKYMLLKIPKIKTQLIQNHVRIVIVSEGEKMTDIPEYKDFNTRFPGTDWNQRVRGFGGSVENPICSCGEENLLCLPNDRYRGESILVHEFAHTIHMAGISTLDKNFEINLNNIYGLAKKRGLWVNTYAISNMAEYFAVGVQCWFNVYRKSIPADGVHNEIGTRTDLQFYDPDLYAFLRRYFADGDPMTICQTRMN